MTITHVPRRALGTMIAYGFPGRPVAGDLAIARRLGASLVEILPDWRSYPDPAALRDQVADAELSIHSAHGCWGGQSIRASRVDLAALDQPTRRASVDDLKACVDWLAAAGGTSLVVHPGGLSDADQLESRRLGLVASLAELADHARGTGVVLCIENLPPGVHPGSRSAELAAVVAELGRPEIALALDTGHANITSSAAAETLDSGPWLRTTHVHDNDGRHDTHLPPGLGTVDWTAWLTSLNAIGYCGPIMLECIRYLRDHADSLTDALRERLHALTEVRPE